MESLLLIGSRWIQYLQSGSPALDGIMKFLSFLGTIEFYLILLPFLYWNLSPRWGFRTLVILIGTDGISTALKQMLAQPRPYWAYPEIRALGSEASYGIPSSHASNSLAAWSYLASKISRRWFWTLVLLLVLLIGLSRLYLGVHFPHDVLGGWLLGAATFGLALTLERPLADWVRGRQIRWQLALSLLMSLALVGVGQAVAMLTRAAVDPPEWASYALQARDLSHYYTLAGSLLGAAAGYALMRKYVNFSVRAAWSLRIIRYVAGMVIVIIIWRGLDGLFGMLAPDEAALGLALRYVRYAATTGWAMLGAPWLFVRLKLATVGGASAGPLEGQPAPLVQG